jgi:4-hydroxy-3-methylbut-2-enyl diphosphate reductase
MNYEIVQPAGFCAGVKRAINLAQNALQKYPRVYCLGELIHNEDVVDNLCARGLKMVSDLDQISDHGGALVIRSHGCPPEVYRLVEARGITLIDATCPIVKRIQKLCQDFSNQGKRIIIFGEREHEEVKSLLGFSNGRAEVVENLIDAQSIKIDENTILISQSTKDEQLFLELKSIMVKKGLPEKNVYNTICSDIKSRQQKVKELSKRVAVFFILGSKNSANTRNLFEIARINCPHCYLISRLDEVPELDEKEIKIGVATGASTPYNFLNSIIEKIKS